MKSFAANVFVLQFLLFFAICAQGTVKLQTFQGTETIPFAAELARISNIVYKEYPYLYDVEDDDQFYLTKFCHSPEAKICLAFDGTNIIGYAIGVPLEAYSQSFQRPFFDFKLDVKNFFYLGELALLPAYREQGIGKRMLLQIEELVKKEGKYPQMCLVHIDESKILTTRPANYISLSTFWSQIGYEQCPNLSLNIEWKNVGESCISTHTLIYWIKSLK